MNRVHKECLKRNHIFLLENLEPSHVVPYLFRDGVISRDIKEKILLAHKIRAEKSETLLDHLTRCGPRAFESFKNALRKTQSFIADERFFAA